MTVKEYKDALAANVTPEVYADVIKFATYMLNRMPRGRKAPPLGTATAGIMLAAMAFAENAKFAQALVQERQQS